MKPHESAKSSAAFTLIELLAVIAIMILIGSMIAPAVGRMLRGKEITRATNDIAGAIEVARAEAMAKNTYVRIAFENAVVNGNWQLQIAAVRSLDGTLTNTGTANLRAVMKPLKFDNVALVNFTNLQSGDAGLATMLNNAGSGSGTGGVWDIADDPMFALKNVPVNGLTVNNQFQALVITPQGEAISTTTPSSFLTSVRIGFRRTVGAPQTTSGVPATQQASELSASFLPTDPDKSVLLLYGGTGQTRIFRLQ